MDIGKISSLIQQMNDNTIRQQTIRNELAVAMQDLAQVQQRIALLERELRNRKEEYFCLDQQLRPELAHYLQGEHLVVPGKRILA